MKFLEYGVGKVLSTKCMYEILVSAYDLGWNPSVMLVMALGGFSKLHSRVKLVMVSGEVRHDLGWNSSCFRVQFFMLSDEIRHGFGWSSLCFRVKFVMVSGEIRHAFGCSSSCFRMKFVMVSGEVRYAFGWSSSWSRVRFVTMSGENPFYEIYSQCGCKTSQLLPDISKSANGFGLS